MSQVQSSNLLLRVAALLAGLVSTGILWFSHDTFLLSGGSDAPNIILAPPLAGQFGAAILLMLLPHIMLFRSPRTGFVIAAVWLIIFALSTHRIVIDSVRGELREVWALIPVQRTNIGGPDGPAAVVRHNGFAHVILGAAVGSNSLVVLKGVAPLAIDFSPLQWR
jgi:hypothetical protein